MGRLLARSSSGSIDRPASIIHKAIYRGTANIYPFGGPISNFGFYLRGYDSKNEPLLMLAKEA